MNRFVILAALSVGACYKANIQLAQGSGARSPVVDDKMHFSLIGVVELSSPIDL